MYYKILPQSNENLYSVVRRGEIGTESHWTMEKIDLPTVDLTLDQAVETVKTLNNIPFIPKDDIIRNLLSLAETIDYVGQDENGDDYEDIYQRLKFELGLSKEDVKYLEEL